MKTNATVPILLTLLISSLVSIALNAMPATASAVREVTSQYPTIQAAINAANENDIILVEAGTYQESVVINKTLTLTGAGKNVTFIKGQSLEPVITIEANNVTLSGFTVRGGLSGVSLPGYNASVISGNVVISNSNQGIALQFSQGNTIAYNMIYLNGFEGILLQNVTDSLVNNNIVTQNEYVGIELSYSSNNRISNNSVTFHSNVTFHDQGIWVNSSKDNTVDGNTIAKNAWGIDIYSSTNNLFYHNNFVNNTHQADRDALSPSNSWDNGSEGNYWSDYIGPDGDGDGIGDTAYDIGSTGDKDNYPLVNQWNPITDDTPPITDHDYDEAWHTLNFNITLTAADDLSGVQATYYRINNDTIKSVNANGQPYISEESANNTLEYWSVDFAGNQEFPHHVLTGIKLDKTVPSGSILINSGDTYTTSPSVTLSLSASDTLSGVSGIRFSNNGIDWSISWEPYSTSKVWNLSSGDGLKTVYVQYLDNALLRSQTYNDTIVLDTTAPMISILSPSMDSVVTSPDVTIDWNGTDAGTGIDHFEIRLDSGPWIDTANEQTYTFMGLSDGGHTVEVKALDKIGQSRQTSVSFAVDTSLFGAIGYIKEIALVVTIAVALAVALYIFKMRRRRRLERESDLFARSRTTSLSSVDF